MGKFYGEMTVIKNHPELGLNERQLILKCSRLELNDGLREQTEKIIHKPLDWDTVLFYSKYHSVASLLRRNIKLLNILDLIPRSVDRALLSLSHRNEYQNRILAKYLNNLLVRFREAEIPLIVLKGLSLVELIYGHLMLRPLIDLNLLIPSVRLREAKNLLFEAGFSPSTKAGQGGTFSHIHLMKRGSYEIHVMLQWHLLNIPTTNAINIDRIWARAQSVRLCGSDALIPSPEDLVLYLCLQPDKHGVLNILANGNNDLTKFVFTEWANNRLIRFVDIYEVIRHHRKELDWNMMVEMAKTDGVQGSFYSSLKWVNKLMGQVADPWVLNALSPPNPRLLRKWFFESLVQQTNGQASPSSTIAVLGNWWLKQPKRSQLRIFDLIVLLEFVLPTLDGLKLFYGLSSKKLAIAFYPVHVFKTSFGTLIPWIYRVKIRKLPRQLTTKIYRKMIQKSFKRLRNGIKRVKIKKWLRKKQIL